MSGSYRGKDNFVVVNSFVGFLVFCLFVFVVWSLGSSHGERSAKTYSQTQHYADATDHEIEKTCIGTNRSFLVECIAQIVNTTREAQRSEYDLKAQIDTAHWTFWMLVISGLGSFLTLVGIWFVRENLIEMQRQRDISDGALDLAREANKVAKDTGQKQIRAYLTCAGGGYKVDRNGLQLKPVIHNTGQSPASSIEIEGSIHSNRVQIPGLEVIGIPDNVIDILKKHMTIDNEVLGHGTCGVIASAHKEVGNVNWLHSDMRASDLEDILTQKGKFDIRLRIKWKDVYGDPQTVVVVLNSVDDKQDFASDLSVRTGAMTAYNQKIY